MSKKFHQITIVGLGLMGGSLGMAIKRHGLARKVVGLSREAATLRRAKQKQAIDEGTTDAHKAVRGAEIVVLAAPVNQIVPLGRRLAPSMPQGSILTDVGSTKENIVHAFERDLPTHVSFVGAHPIAGSEKRGINAAEASLFENTFCIVTPTSHTHPLALKRVRALWQQIGQKVISLSPKKHDQLLAGASHLPHLIAACLMHAVHTKPLPSAPRSLMEMTRIAKSDPDLWDDIYLSNKRALLEAMDRFTQEWSKMREYLIKSQDATLRRWLAQAQKRRVALED